MCDDRCTNDLNMVCELKLKREMELDFNKLILIKYQMWLINISNCDFGINIFNQMYYFDVIDYLRCP